MVDVPIGIAFVDWDISWLAGDLLRIVVSFM